MKIPECCSREDCIYIFKRLLLIIVRVISWIDYGYRKFVQWVIPFSYKREGKCRQCGQCCKEILIGMEPRMLKISFLRNFAVWWNKYFNNLHLIGSLLDDGIMVFACDYLTPEGKCGNYNWSRPVFCHEYPRLFNYFETPTVMSGCGFKFSARK